MAGRCARPLDQRPGQDGETPRVVKEASASETIVMLLPLVNMALAHDLYMLVSMRLAVDMSIFNN